MNAQQPIGIFDSGIGGLTVARAVYARMPQENIIYFGDTAHLPYGEKSQAAIQAYTVKICDFLIQHDCKLILIACNSASAAAFELAREYVASRAKVFNVIDPMVEYVGKNFPYKSIGLIGTRATVLSGVYAQKIEHLQKAISLKSLATPLLVPLIEEGYSNSGVSHTVIEGYLKEQALTGIEALILGCTHYPLIKQEIASYYEGGVDVLDGADLVAASVQHWLDAQNLRHLQNPKPWKRFYVSDLTGFFKESAELFFKEKISLEYYRLWE